MATNDGKGEYKLLDKEEGSNDRPSWRERTRKLFFGDRPLQRKLGERWNPEEDANFLSRITFWWVGPLIGLGNRKALVAEDLWDINRGDASSAIAPLIFQSWEKEALQAKPSVTRALWRTFGLYFSLSGLIKLCQDCVQFLNPVILKQIMLYLQSSTDPVVKGVLLVSLLLSCNILQSILLNNYFHQVYRISIRIRVAIISLIYGKSLKISSAAKQNTSQGQIVNLQSNDSEKIAGLIVFLHILWSGPFQILGALCLLFSIIGIIPTLCGVAVMVLAIPLNGLLARWLTAIRKRLLTATDARVKVISEVIGGIKAIKLYAWETPFKQRVDSLRETEMKEIRKAVILSNIQRFVISLNTLLVSVASLSAYSFLGNKLDAAVAFPALALFNQLQFPLTVLPRLLNSAIQALVSAERLEKFLALPETTPMVQSTENEEGSLGVFEGSFTWAPEEQADQEEVPNGESKQDTLQGINLRVNPGQLLLVIGKVGSGKSSLLAAILGEIRKTAGSVFLNGSVAYTSQDPWIQNASLKDNILMGQPFSEDKYEDTLEACALLEDLKTLPGGDQAEIGEKGINLSGGQKHRVALARAVYSEAQIYLLDDPLSAVDTHVGRHLFDRCLCGVLAGRTRVLVTHQLQYAESADSILVLDEGKVLAYGSYQELLAQGVDFSHFQVSEDDPPAYETAPAVTEISPTNPDPQAVSAPLPNSTQKPLKPAASAPDLPRSGKKSSSSALTQQEHRSVGRVKGSVYWAYFKAWGPGMVLPVTVLGLFLLANLAKLGNDVWLAFWTQGVQQGSASILFYLGIYCLTALLTAGMNLARSLSVAVGSLTAARNLHRGLVETTLRLPMAFFDSQPSGRLVNRFTRDTEQVDLSLSESLFTFVSFSFQTVFAVGLVVYVTPVFVLPLGPVILVYLAVQNFYISTSRELRRIDSISRSPIFAFFGETVQGLGTIRAFARQAAFGAENARRVDALTRANFASVASNRWLGVRSDLLAALTVFSTALLCVLVRSGNPGFAGLAITNALSVTLFMNWLVRSSAELETQMNSVERVMEYASLDAEAPAVVEACRPPASWPERGAIEAQGVVVRYRAELAPVLAELSFSIGGGEKVGVCGRTGCGKTTLMMALFRIMELDGGRIVIDEIDVARIGLFDLRSRLALVPQDPVIFSGTVRLNLDPFGDSGADSQLWEALARAGMSECIRGLPGQLDADVAEGGSNFSTGQRQLLCMARALLRGTKILVLDEATSNVDSATDAVIQSTIRTAFRDCTVLTIAHRLHTVIDSDRILLLEKGRLAEFDTPAALLDDAGSAFSGFVDQTMPREASFLRNVAAVKRSSSRNAIC